MRPANPRSTHPWSGRQDAGWLDTDIELALSGIVWAPRARKSGSHRRNAIRHGMLIRLGAGTK
jgi:hypothetical protein